MQQLFHQLFSSVQAKPFAVKYPSGDLVQYGPQGNPSTPSGRSGQAPTFTLIFKTRKAMQAVLTSIDLGFAEAYMFGDLEIDGKLSDLMELAMVPGGLEEAALKNISRPGFILANLPSILKTVPLQFFQTNTYAQSKQYMSLAYDTGNDFFKLLLDKDMLYTCAYFKSPEDTLDQAQEQKREHVCRKLMLKPGEHLLDIGCGWGGMLLYAAKHYGISGMGITLSKAQQQEATERIAKAGLQDRLKVELMDYRDLPSTLRFDKMVSMGCFEHIGGKNYRHFLLTAKRALAPNGLFLLHFIGNKGPNRPSLFGRKYLFPGVHTPPLFEASKAISQEGFRVHDVENLRIHYSYTAQRWLENLERHEPEIRNKYGEVFVRIYRLYLTHGVAFCRYGAAELFQILLTPDVNPALPLTRDHLCNKK
jgi:cyclopropane-fatty-acyl-phospholipid synthase